MRKLLAAALVFFAFPLHAAPLATPALGAGQNILVENGEITVSGIGTVTVVRYAWRDAGNVPRSVALVPASASTSGYALRFTYQVAGATVNVDADAVADGGFGYFVSHELFRDFDGDGSGDDTIASLHGEDDSPLGRYLPSTGSDSSVGTTQATHEFRLNYPRWGTVAAMPNPDAQVSTSAAAHQKYQLPVVIRWHFVSGQNFPLWSVEYNLSGATDHIANDVRGPYGVMHFAEASPADVTALRWGDKYKFAADAGASDLATAASPAGGTTWAWNVLNTGRRYNVLSSGQYEFGLVDTVPYSQSKYGDSYAIRRNSTKAALGGCVDNTPMTSLPCEWEWAYQSMQYEGAPSRPKLAWGASFYLGTSLTQVYVQDNPPAEQNETISGTGRIHYGLHIVLGKSGTGAVLTLARAAVPMEADPTLTVSHTGTGTLSYTVLGDGATYTTSRTLKPWDSVRLQASGGTFTGWSGACAGVAGTVCIITMDASRSVTAAFGAAGGSLTASTTAIDFGGQSMGTTSPPITVTLTNNAGATATINSVSTAAPFAVDASQVSSTLAAGASVNVFVYFTPPAAAGAVNSTTVLLGTLSVSSTQGNPSVNLSGLGERSLITHFYRSILRRAPDAGGKQFWQNEAQRFQNIGANINETWYAMAQFFYASAEYIAFNRDNSGFVTDLYNTFFNRAPDAGGLNFWVGQLNSGLPREVALAGFMFSPEFASFTQGIFGNTAARAEVDTVMDFYRGLLARTPDQSGYDFWVARFRAAQCAGAGNVYGEVESISSSFANGAEYLGRNRTNAQYVGDLYSSFLRRGGDLNGVNFWINQLNTTQTRNQVRQQFIGSSEFQGRVNAIVAQGCAG
jgi:hypothetical protein